MVVIGRIGAPHGINGWVRVFSFTDPTANICLYENLQLEDSQGNWAAITINNIQPHRAGFIAKLSGINDRDSAALLTNMNIGVKREELPDTAEGEYYWEDLIGCSVNNENGINLGKIINLFNTGANDVMVVKSDERERLIPYVADEFVLNVDLAARQMQVRWDQEL